MHDTRNINFVTENLVLGAFSLALIHQCTDLNANVKLTRVPYEHINKKFKVVLRIVCVALLITKQVERHKR